MDAVGVRAIGFREAEGVAQTAMALLVQLRHPALGAK